MYETTVAVNINEWIRYKLVVKDKVTELFINDSKYSTMIVNELKGKMSNGSLVCGWILLQYDILKI